MNDYDVLGMALTAMREKKARLGHMDHEDRREWAVAIERIEDLQREQLK